MDPQQLHGEVDFLKERVSLSSERYLYLLRSVEGKLKRLLKSSEIIQLPIADSSRPFYYPKVVRVE